MDFLGILNVNETIVPMSSVGLVSQNFVNDTLSYHDDTEERCINNPGNNGSDVGDYVPPLKVQVLVFTIMGLAVLTGIVGNILVLVVIAAVKSMHTTVNKCLFSLGLADLIVLVFLPILPTAIEFTDDMSFLGKNFCTFLSFYDRGAAICSVLLFLYITVDRYKAMCYPLSPRRLSSGRNIYVTLVVIWVVALISSVPYLYVADFVPWQQGNQTYYQCNLNYEPRWKLDYEIACSIIVFYVPIPFLAFLYGRMIWKIARSVPMKGTDGRTSGISGRRGRHQVIIMLLIVVAVFLVCQLPFKTLVLIDTYWPSVFTFEIFDSTVFAALWTSRILLYLNSAINPILYFSLSSNFRKAFRVLFRHCRKDKPGTRSSTELPTVYSNVSM